MTQKQLISKLQELKQVKPRKDWVLLAKMDILGLSAKTESIVMERKAIPQIQPSYKWNFSNILGLIYQRKFAYAFAVFLFIFMGMFGIAQYTLPGDMLFSVKKMTEQSQASLIGESNIKNNFENLKKRSQDLAQAVKDKKDGNISFAIKEVRDATSSLNDAIAKDPKLAKEFAVEIKDNKTLLDNIGGEDLKQTSDTLYKTIDSQMIADLQNTSLTESQQKTLTEINDLYNQGKYFDALEKILLIK